MGGESRTRQARNKQSRTASATTIITTTTNQNDGDIIINHTTTPPSSSTTTVTTIGSSLIPMINKLQDILSPLCSDELSEIPLPHVAVVGSQSSGKSSVLEAIVGRDFLPRGAGICTRCPLILQLVRMRRTSDDHLVNNNNEVVEDNGREWGEFLHLPQTKFFDFSRIRQEIQAETEREAGKNKGVSEKAIRLKIYSQNVLDITLVDLPGITKVPVGDQPTDIEARIRKMIMKHITQENSIILAVSPANTDLATSDALQLAKQADPHGNRTIGVITKLDIMDKGTDACNFLLGKTIPLRLGYIGVVNRSQADINKNRSISEALNFEEKFFLDHPVYHSIRDRCGIPQLAKKLNEILEHHIRGTLPTLRSKLNSHFRDVEEGLKTYGDPMESKEKQGAIVLDILRDYSEAFCALIDGKNPELPTKELIGGARIRYIFQQIFIKALEEVDPCEDLTDQDIRIAIQNSMGPRNKLFVPEVPFEILIRRQIKRMLDPSLQCLQFVCNELVKMSHSCESKELQRFPTFRQRLQAVMQNFLYDAMKLVEKRVVDTIDMEADDINTSHPNFLGGQTAIEVVKQHLHSSKGGQNSSGNKHSLVIAEKRRSKHHELCISGSLDGNAKETTNRMFQTPGNAKETRNRTFQTPTSIQLKSPSASIKPTEEPTDEEITEILVTRILLKSYFDIVRKKIEDDVTKAIMHFLVNYRRRDLYSTFIRILYRDELFKELLQENFEVTKKRKRTVEMYKVLQKAVQTLRDFESSIPSSNPDNYQSPPQQTSSKMFTSIYGTLYDVGLNITLP